MRQRTSITGSVRWLVGRSVGLSVTHSLDDQNVAPYWSTWPCYTHELCKKPHSNIILVSNLMWDSSVGRDPVKKTQLKWPLPGFKSNLNVEWREWSACGEQEWRIRFAARSYPLSWQHNLLSTQFAVCTYPFIWMTILKTAHFDVRTSTHSALPNMIEWH